VAVLTSEEECCSTMIVALVQEGGPSSLGEKLDGFKMPVVCSNVERSEAAFLMNCC
jgi:hypothetical protein